MGPAAIVEPLGRTEKVQGQHGSTLNGKIETAKDDYPPYQLNVVLRLLGPIRARLATHQMFLKWSEFFLPCAHAKAVTLKVVVSWMLCVHDSVVRQIASSSHQIIWTVSYFQKSDPST